MFETVATLDQFKALTGINNHYGKVMRRYWQAQTRVFGAQPLSKKVSRALDFLVGVPPDRVWLALVDNAFAQGGFLDFV